MALFLLVIFMDEISIKCQDTDQDSWTGCAYMSRLPGADMDLSSLLLGHSKGLLKERFLSMARTKI